MKALLSDFLSFEDNLVEYEIIKIIPEKKMELINLPEHLSTFNLKTFLVHTTYILKHESKKFEVKEVKNLHTNESCYELVSFEDNYTFGYEDYK